jgi:hypothetical protein
MVERMNTCPDCGQPLERADDFWYCDNPDCPGNGRPRRPTPDAPEPPVASDQRAERPVR